MKSIARIFVKLVCNLTVLAICDSKFAMSQERPEFEMETDSGTVTQASLEISEEPVQQAQAPRIVFRAGDPATIDRENEGYEIRFESIDGSNQKRIKLSVPISVEEVEISHLTIPPVNETGSSLKLAPTNLNIRPNSVPTDGRSHRRNSAPPSGIPFANKHQLLPIHDQVAGRLKNPYYFGKNAEDKKPDSLKVLQDYATTPYNKINESLSDEPTLSDRNSGRVAEKLDKPVQARITDLNDFQ